MSIYVDSSALLKRYVDEPDSAACVRLLESDPGWITARHTWVEVVRTIAKVSSGRDRATATREFQREWARIAVVELDADTCRRAGEIAAAFGVRTLDALHLAALGRAGGTSIPLLTYDLRQASVARALGMPVVGT